MPATVRFYTDPAGSWSWGAEPALRRLIWEFTGELEFSWVMGGLARSYGKDYSDEEGQIGKGPDCFADLISHWLDVTAETEMPCDPRIWTENPLSGTYRRDPPRRLGRKGRLGLPARRGGGGGEAGQRGRPRAAGGDRALRLLLDKGVEELNGKPAPLIEAELWALAGDWKLKAVPALTGTVWEIP